MKNYDLTVAADVLEQRMGFRQTIAKKEYLPLDDDLVADPLQGQLFVNSVSEYWLRVEAMAQALEFIEGYDIDTYDNGTDYTAGEKVKKVINDRTFVWVAKQANGPGSTVEDPETSTDFWESYLSNRLREYRVSASRETISSVISAFADKVYSPEMKSSTTFYKERSGPRQAQLQGRFVGIEIKPNENCKLSKIFVSGKIGLFITGSAANDINIYFYHSSRPDAPIQTYTISSADIVLDRFKWYDLKDGDQELVIDLYDELQQQGGRYYLGFDEGELSGNGQGYKFYETILGERVVENGFSMLSVEIRSEFVNSPALPDLGEYYDHVSFNDEVPINLRYEVSESYYPMIKENVHLFDSVYRYKLAMSILTDMMHSGRIGHVADNAEAKIDEILYGQPDNPQNNGIVAKLEGHKKKLMKDLSSLFEDNMGAFDGPV